MSYVKTVWENSPSVKTPLSSDNMNHIEDGIESVDQNCQKVEQNCENLETLSQINQVTITTNAEIAENTDYEILIPYQVGNESLKIIYMGEELSRNVHYKEVGEAGEVSRIIQFYDWGQDVPAR